MRESVLTMWAHEGRSSGLSYQQLEMSWRSAMGQMLSSRGITSRDFFSTTSCRSKWTNRRQSA